MTDSSIKPMHGGGHPAKAIAKTADPDPVSRHRLLGAYKQMLASLFIATLVVIAAIVLLILPLFVLERIKFIDHSEGSSIFGAVVLAGALGALFSALIRLYNLEDLPKALIADELEGLPGKYLLIYSLVPIVVGAIAAAVIYLVFAGKLLSIPNFTPDFDCIGGKCDTFMDFVANWSPKGGENFAKVLVWGFVAGFAERLVPDTLRTLTRSTDGKSHDQDKQS